MKSGAVFMDRERINFKIPSLFFNIKTINATSTSFWRDLHLHDSVELIQVDSGNIICHIGEICLSLSKDDTLLINSHVIHKLERILDAEITYIQINMENYIAFFQKIENKYRYISDFINKIHTCQYYLSHGKSELSELFFYMKKEVALKAQHYDAYIKSYIFHLAAFMYRYGLISEKLPSNRLADLIPVIIYIDKNFGVKLNLDELSQLVHRDKFQLCHLFKSVTGRSVFDYITFVRIRTAEEKLMNTNKNISEIALECGFSSIQYFNKVFKKTMGCPPSLFRKQLIL